MAMRLTTPLRNTTIVSVSHTVADGQSCDDSNQELASGALPDTQLCHQPALQAPGQLDSQAEIARFKRGARPTFPLSDREIQAVTLSTPPC